LRRKYNAAREAYAAWSDEAAEAVGAGRNIDLGSEKAQRAKEALNNLANFADEYVAQQEKLRSSASRFNSGAGDEIKELAGFVKAHWQQIEAVAKAIKKWRTRVQEERDQRAKQVQAAGDWLKFEDIK